MADDDAPDHAPGSPPLAELRVSDDEIRRGLEGRRLRADLRARLFGVKSDAVRIGPYRVLRKVAEGGMGAIYETQRDGSGERIAVKVVHTPTEAGQARLLREGKTMARLRHGNVVAVHEVGHCDEGLFIAMDFVDGPTLRGWCTQPSPPASDAVLARIVEAAEGLSAGHELGVLHRDVKPDNILIDGDGHARVTDFGLAKSLPGSAAENLTGFTARLTATGTTLGTVGYMSPEQLLGTQLTPATDQFALAVTAFEALYGTPPFGGSTADAVAMAIVDGRVTPPAPERIANARVHAVIERALAPEAADRHPSMVAFAAALRGETTATATGSWWSRLRGRR